MNLTCRDCASAMTFVQHGDARFWECVACGAHALTDVSFRKLLPDGVWGSVWSAVRAAGGPGARGCPACAKAMSETAPLADAGGIRVDFCGTCRVLWFDPKELARAPLKPVEEEAPGLPPEARKAMGRVLAEIAAGQYDELAEQVNRLTPISILRVLLGALP